jgi:hypothetical protein
MDRLSHARVAIDRAIRWALGAGTGPLSLIAARTFGRAARYGYVTDPLAERAGVGSAAACLDRLREK